MQQLSYFAALALLVGGCATDYVDASARALAGSPVDRPGLIHISDQPAFLSERPTRWTSAIVGGQPVTSDPAVALILAVDASENILGLCSGTLIAPRRVLTAAHCVDGRIPAAGFAVYFGTELSQTDPGFIFLTDAESVLFHPFWNPDNLEAGNDVGIIFLREAPPIQPIPIRTAPLGAADVGSPIALVGWGLTGGGADDSGVKRFAQSSLRQVDDLLIDVGDGNIGTCNGDSGGPAFMTNAQGVAEVIGVTSFGDVDCEQLSIDTRVDAFKQFISSDGNDLDRPGGGGGFGDPCASFDTCDSGICVTDGASGFCSELCDPAATFDSCPDGTACTDFDGTAACAPTGDGDGDGGDGDGGGFPPLRSDDGGCSAAGGRSASGLLLLLAMFGVIRRRRR